MIRMPTPHMLNRLLKENAKGGGMSLEGQKIILEQLLEFKQGVPNEASGPLFDRLRRVRDIHRKAENLVTHLKKEADAIQAEAVDAERREKKASVTQ